MNQFDELPATFILLRNSKAIQDELYQKARYWLTSIVKDDVFFAPSSEMCMDTITQMPTPSLSPVTSPSDFLYEREPLFDGIENYLQQDSDLLSSTLSNITTTTTTTTTLFSDDELEQVEFQSSNNSNKRLSQNAAINLKSKRFKSDHDKMTLFEQLTQVGIDWCRYCGTTEGVNWRPGPWGKRTLCNKHGCDYKGYGLASRLPRLDLSAFLKESLQDRKRPIFLVMEVAPVHIINTVVVT
ncbi:hypothetical protein G6F46_004134 [Rhizopus delemar]|uniref:GATA-type domain-containing protein n=2 Tax=Rhizopus TaxID=4842 RepID=A0A9P6YWD1_9FUNG|nr:hypothetical protein G6F55_009060 [Rhizopus delemar]KAG1551970.1 hypothetical protein G6F51_001513 [Rhizopus arrhizus]KAG1492493.1 hypothetical protein G6F54_009272 [Rhizopus delemar]KAG1509973.1 hypothetical protein G6F53_007034 [Rhizopus delemar]KAG1525790.1 hypothetical protein G6F52_003009 [Rhizopus delemar]